MSHPAVRPIREVSHGRLQEAGKLKIGKLVPTTNGRSTRPASIETFRFTTRDRAQVDKLAAMYGGTVVDAGGLFDLESEAKEINVILPPDPLGGTPIYEQWSGGGCTRRCDGEEVTVPIRTGDDVSFMDRACICAEEDDMQCKPTVRLSVIIPETSLTGVWNLRTNSWAATREMEQMVALIDMAQTRGLVAATLAIEPRKQVSGGKTKNFVVPVLRLQASLYDLAAGAGVATLGSGSMAGLAPPPAPALTAQADVLTEDDRASLNAAWKTADEECRRDAMNYLSEQGVEGLGNTPHSLVQDVLDRLVVHGAELA